MRTLLFALALCVTMAVQAKPFTPAALSSPAAATLNLPQSKSHGFIESQIAVADPMFGVHDKVLGLERRVEMFQWQRVGAPLSDHYEQKWSAARIDSSGFDALHKNAGDFPFNGERWWTSEPRLEGHPVSASVIGTLDAWSPLKPNLAQLPTNLAVSFQPAGDWLSTSQNDANPRVGDVRVQWRAIGNAPAPKEAVLISGTWQLSANTETAHTAAATPAPASTSDSKSTDVQPSLQRILTEYAWWIAGGFLLALILLAWRRRR